MKELSLHILDLVQNSIAAGASLIKITIREDIRENVLMISIEDNGRGMDESTIEKAKNPFFTSRTTRKVGLGIPLFMAAAQRCEGDFKISSLPGKGTTIEATFKHSHIDRAPIGNMWDTLTGLIMCNENIDFEYVHVYNGKVFEMKTCDLKKVLKGVPISSPQVIGWINEYLKDGIKSLYGGVVNEDNPGT
jgi:Signal transduction histidine kinase